MQHLQGFFSYVQRALHAYTHARMHEYAAMLSFFAILSLPALFSVLFAVLRTTLPQETLALLLSSLLPHLLLQETLLPFLAQSYTQQLALSLVFSLSIALFALRHFFVHLSRALGALWKHAPSSSLRAHLLPFAPLVLLGVALLVLVLGNTLLATLVPLALPARILSSLFFLGLSSAVCGLFFLLSSDRALSFVAACLGGTFTACCLLFGQFLLGGYFHIAHIEASFGVLGSAAMLLLWIYYCLSIFLFGASVTSATLSRHEKKHKRLA